MSDNVAKNLTSYVAIRYTEKDLGLLRLLCSFPLFRLKAESSSFGRFGVMLSFEKFIRERHGLALRRVTNVERRGITCEVRSYRSGATDTIYRVRDDRFGSGSRMVVESLRKIRSGYDSFPASPVVQLGHGPDVNDLLSASLDWDSIRSVIISDVKFDNAVDTFDDYREAMVRAPDTELYIWKMFEFLSDCLLDVRRSNTCGSVERDFATDEEILLVLTGKLKKSIKDIADIPACMQKSLLEIYPGSKIEAGQFLQEVPFSTKLWDLLGEEYEHVRVSEEWLDYIVPADERKSAKKALFFEEQIPSVSAPRPAPRPSASIEPAAPIPARRMRLPVRVREEPLDPTLGKEEDEDAVALALSHAEKWRKRDHNKGDYHLDLITCGTEKGAAIWKGFGHGKKKKVFALAKEASDQEGGIPPERFLCLVAQQLKELCETRHSEYTFLMLAAGRVSAAKSQIVARSGKWVFSSQGRASASSNTTQAGDLSESGGEEE